MQIVIDIPAGFDWSKVENGSIATKILLKAVRNGTPVQNAHWVLYRDHENMIDYPQCSNCDTIIKLPLPIDNLNFCPNCGRHMI